MVGRNEIQCLVHRSNVNEIRLQILCGHVLDTKFETDLSKVILKGLEDTPSFIQGKEILRNFHKERERGIIIHRCNFVPGT